MHAFSRHCPALLILAASLLVGPAISQPAAYPTKPIVVISPWPGGGGADAVARPIFQKLSDSLGQQILIDSKPGADGEIGTAAAARAAPDGYTLLFAQFGPNVLSHVLDRKPQYDTLRDFKPVTQLVSGALVLVVRASLPVNSLRELIDYAKANPGKLNYATAGPGSTPQLVAEMFKQRAGVQMQEIPYKGSGQYVLDMAAGRIDLAFASVGAAGGHIRAGTLRPLAVTTLKRVSVLPEVPTVAQAYPGFEFNSWYGVMVPAKTPDEIVQRLATELRKVVLAPEMSSRLQSIAQEPEASSPEQFESKIRSDIAFWAKEVRVLGAAPKN